MCNNYEQHVRHAELVDALAAAGLTLPEHQSDADLPQADDIRIGDVGPVLREAGNGVEIAPMSFGFPPKGRGGPVFNFRSEGRSFADNRRCLVPASAFFEFTGKKYPKAKHRFTLAGEPLLAIAGLWRETDGNKPPAFTMLTTAPGDDVAPYHDRQVAVLRPSEWSAWIYLTRPESELLAPLPAGSINVERVRPGSD